MKFSEKNLDMLVDKLIGNPNISVKERAILDRYYNSGDSFSKKIRDLKNEARKLALNGKNESLSDEFSNFYEKFIKDDPLDK